MNFEAQHAAESLLLPAGDLVTRVAGQSGIVDPADEFMLVKYLCEQLGVLLVLLHANEQRSDAPQCQV